jgi:hypothetical protein
MDPQNRSISIDLSNLMQREFFRQHHLSVLLRKRGGAAEAEKHPARDVPSLSSPTQVLTGSEILPQTSRSRWNDICVPDIGAYTCIARDDRCVSFHILSSCRFGGKLFSNLLG